MEHARELELIELAARRLEGDRRKTVLTHIENCATCRTKLQDIQRTWDLLGAWQVQPPGRVEVAEPGAWHAAQDEHSAPTILRLPNIRMTVRIAATIVVGVLIGYTGGRWSVRPIPPSTGPEPPSYFSVLDLESGDSLASLVLEDAPSASQEGRT